MSKEKPERFQLGQLWLSKHTTSPNWCITWHDRRSKQTKRLSTGTSDFEKAQQVLAKHWITQSELKEERPESVPISQILDRYYEAHASKIPSKLSAASAIAKWKEFWRDDTVADLTFKRQEEFIKWLEAYTVKTGSRKGQKLSRATISTQLSVGAAAIRYAIKRQELRASPHLIPYKHNSRRTRVLTLDESAALINAAAETEHMWRWVLLAFATAARPNAVLEIRPTPPMVDLDNGIINLLPPGQQQNKKRRPIVPVAQTLMPWLRRWTRREALVHEARRGKKTKVTQIDRLITWRGKRIKDVRMGFQRLKAAAGITDELVCPVTIRHTMTTWLVKQRVPAEQREIFIGHRMPGSETTAGYVHLDPDYLRDAAAAVDAYFDALASRLKRPLRVSSVLLQGGKDKLSD